ncbi:hypothetical protein ABT297_40690 [Dactylosporangium sp. NPDC000555]|uniref:hypothetical protein n=1 Tax=Dactylosporangium sp. NPDC000555 TaxID=3154260 RepID=UPI00331E53B7
MNILAASKRIALVGRSRTTKLVAMGAALAIAATGYLVVSAVGGDPPAGAKAILNLPRIDWEGGPSYWKQFEKADAAGWNDPSYIPIGVFYGRADSSHVASLKDAGINLYMNVEHDPKTFPLTNVTNAGIYVMPGPDWTLAEVGNNPMAVGWFVSDECDMGYTECTPDWNHDNGEYGRLAVQQSYVKKLRGYNDGRFLHANFGNGILRTFWANNTMDDHIKLMDSASADKYTYTSPDVAGLIDGSHDAPDWPSGTPVARAYSYGWQVDQMKRFQDPARLKPIWAFVETAMPNLNEAGARTIEPDQIEGAVWSALIHEARGIAYFQHNNNGRCGDYSIVQCPAVHAAVKAVNSKVKSLAPVLNTQSHYNSTRTVNGFTYQYYTFNNGTDTMLKTYNGSAYIFAGLGMGDATGSKTFALPAGVNGTTVTVVGEDRTIPVTNGSFADKFAHEYTHHVYRIEL